MCARRGCVVAAVGSRARMCLVHAFVSFMITRCCAAAGAVTDTSAWAHFDLNPLITASLARLRFAHPTAVQASALLIFRALYADAAPCPGGSDGRRDP